MRGYLLAWRLLAHHPVGEVLISPRKDEIQAVVSILESDEHESPEAMAGAIVRRLGQLFEERDAYGVGIGLPTDDVELAHGPFYNIGDAKRVVNEARARGLRAFIAPLFGPARALLDEEEALAQRCVCGHPRELHGISMTTFSGKPKPMTSLGCCVYNRSTRQKCDCTTYEKG